MTYELQVKNISKTYKQKKKTIKALENISFDVKKGEIYGLLVPNGAGKSTLIKSICNLIIPDSGYIDICGVNILDKNKKALEKVSAVLDGNRNLYWRLTPVENLKYFAGIRGLGGKELTDKIDFILDILNLTPKKNQPVNFLSTGMKQKLIIGVGLICDTDILLLDEPTLGLDVYSKNELSDILKLLKLKYNKTILVSSHDMEFVQSICDRCLIMNNGKKVTENSISNLINMFNTVNYTIKFIEKIDDTQAEKLLSNYQYVEINEDKTSINLNWDSNLDLYILFDFLNKNNLLIKLIEKNEINLEKIFLNLTKEDKNENIKHI